MAKHVVVTAKQKAAASLAVKRSAATGKIVSSGAKAIASAQPKSKTK